MQKIGLYDMMCYILCFMILRMTLLRVPMVVYYETLQTNLLHQIVQSVFFKNFPLFKASQDGVTEFSLIPFPLL